jgi:hypothetical protein
MKEELLVKVVQMGLAFLYAFQLRLSSLLILKKIALLGRLYRLQFII